MRVRYSFSCRKTGHTENIRKQREKVPDIAKHVVCESDVILEVLDARFVDETRIPEVESAIKKMNKGLIYIFNKIDLLTDEAIKKLKEKIELDKLRPYVFLSCTSRRGKFDLKKMINIEVSKMKIEGRRAKVGIIGYPNTGKSSLINYLVGRGVCGTSPKAGFTKGVKKIRITNNIVVLDTPGVIAKGEYSHDIREKLAKHAKIGARTYSEVKDPEFVVDKIMKQYPGVIEKYYDIDANGNSELLIEILGRRKNWVLKAGEIDTDRTSRFILRDWQEGKIKV